MIQKTIDRVIALSRGKAGDLVYYISFTFVYIFRFYLTTMFTGLIDPKWFKIPYYLGIAGLLLLSGVAVLECIRKKTYREAAELIFILLAGVLCTFIGGWKIVYLMCFLIAASKDRDLKPVFLISVIVGSVIMVSAYLASMNGYIPYLVYNGKTEMLQHAFGMNYRTDLAAHVLFTVMCYGILRAEKLMLWEYTMLWFDTWLIWRYAQARAGSACLVLFLTLMGLAIIYRRIRGEWIKLPKITALVHILSGIAVFIAVALWPETNGIGGGPEGSESIFARLSLSREAFRMYPVNLFGHVVKERGAGGVVDSAEPYFFIDITYVRILIMGGIVLFILYLFLMTKASYKAAERHTILAIALIVTAIHSIIEHHAFEVAYNVLILYSVGTMGKEYITEQESDQR